jgi:ubiquinone/menaquinone biosynthesis C-methylase UbiE
LDVGSGPGRWIVEYSSRGANVVGLDISIKMIKSAKSKLRRESPEAEFVHGDSEHLPFRDGVFDIISCFDAFPDFPHPLECLTEMKRVLKATGTLVVEQTNILSLIGAFITISRKINSIISRIRKKKTGFKLFDESFRYEFPTTIFSWLHELMLTYKIIGVNIIPTLPHEAFLRFLCKVEEKLENDIIFNIVGYRLVFICQKMSAHAKL